MTEEKIQKMSGVIEDSFRNYAGAVLQSRALVDVRDCLKPSARQIFYSMVLHKLVSSNPHKKTANAVGMAMADFYIHGDASCVGIIMHAGQGFSMRYPIVEVKGNPGTQIKSGDWAAPRYTESRLSKITDVLFKDIDKDTINEWRDSYDGSKQYPAVLPSKGFYNIVNGTMGIGIGLASSIPQFNLTEVNNALIHLIQNPDCDFDEIYCAPDFATGAYLLNEAEVKESLKNGTGSSCRLRSVVEYDNKERCFIVTEIPYGVYTSTICGELDKILEDENNPGIDKYNDLTGKTPLIKIYLSKRGNPDRVLKYLFKNTSLQSWYSINMTMLDNGRYPRVFGWKEALQAHIDHEKEVYRNSFSFDLNKMKARVHILDGLLICLASIDEVVKVIKNSKSTAIAKDELCKNFLLDEVQAKAVLDLKLSRLAHLEVEKLKNEKTELEQKIAEIEKILNTEELFNNELIKGWKAVAEKFGDARRTRILNISQADDEEPTEIRSLQISLTNKNDVYVSEVSSLYTQRRGGVGNKAKMDKDEYVLCTKAIESNEEILFFTQSGNFYHYPASALALNEKIAVESLFGIEDWEQIKAITSLNKKTEKSFVMFFTKNGLIKKSFLSEYNMKRSGSLKAITLDKGDEICDILIMDKEKVGIMTEEGNFILIDTDDIRPIGRVAKGIKGMRLNTNDKVTCAAVVPDDTKQIVSVSSSGLFKKTPIDEFSVQGKNTKGSKIQRVSDKETMVEFLPLKDKTSIVVAATRSIIKLTVNDIPELSRAAQGNKSIKLNGTDRVIGISLN